VIKKEDAEMGSGVIQFQYMYVHQWKPFS